MEQWICPKCGRKLDSEGQPHDCGMVETVDQYICAQSEAVQPALNEIRQILREALPDAREKISWGMPTFWKGRNILHFAAFKSTWACIPAGRRRRSSRTGLLRMTSARGRSACRTASRCRENSSWTSRDGVLNNMRSERRIQC